MGAIGAGGVVDGGGWVVFVVGVAAASGGWGAAALGWVVVCGGECWVGGRWVVVAVLGVGLSAVFSGMAVECISVFLVTAAYGSALTAGHFGKAPK